MLLRGEEGSRFAAPAAPFFIASPNQQSSCGQTVEKSGTSPPAPQPVAKQSHPRRRIGPNAPDLCDNPMIRRDFSLNTSNHK